MRASRFRVTLKGAVLLAWCSPASAQFHQPFRPLPVVMAKPNWMAFAPDGKLLAIAEGKTVRLVEFGTGNLVATLRHETAVDCLAFFPDGKTVVSVASSEALCFWEIPSSKREDIDLAFLAGFAADFAVTSLAVCPRENIMAVGTKESIFLLDWHTGRIRQISGCGPHAGTLAFSPCGRLLAGAVDASPPDTGDDSTIATRRSSHDLRVWATAGENTFPPCDDSAGFVCHTAFSPDGRLCAVVSADGRGAVWEVASGKKVLDDSQLHRPSLWLYPMDFADGRTLVYADTFGFQWRDVLTGQELHYLTKHECYKGHHVGFAVSPGGRRLAIATADKGVLFRDGLGMVPKKPAGPRRDLKSLWDDLASADAAVGYRALWEMSERQQAARFLAERVKPFGDETAIKDLILRLDSPRYAIREQASRELKKMAEIAVPYLRGALAEQRSLESTRRIEAILRPLSEGARSPQFLQQMRAIGVLEKCGTPEARALLKRLAQGDASSPWTREATAALDYLARTDKNDKR